MPLYPNDESTLQSWNFVKDYQKNKDDLHALATGAYRAVCLLLRNKAQASQIQPDDCVIILEGMLL